MLMARNSCVYVGNKPMGIPTVKSRRVARNITSKYHLIMNELAILRSKSTSERQEKSSEKRVKELEDELASLGGIKRYQEASIVNTSHFKTSRWVISTLLQLQEINSETSSSSSKTVKRLKLLEVGAINIQLQKCAWLDVRAIDINSQVIYKDIDIYISLSFEDTQ